VRAVAALLVLAAAGATAAPPPDVLDLRVVRADGTVMALREVVGERPAVVAFWATYCAPCRAEVPALNEAAERWRGRGLRVLGVALETDAERVRDAERTWEMRYDVLPIAADQDALTDRLFPRGLPAAAFVAHGAATLHQELLDAAALGRLVPPLFEPTKPAQ
jgi:thiol-disulfide isomerase/thioredoxin